MTQKRVVILGSGLAGLRTASVLIDRGYEVTVIERAPMGGGCTSSWTDHRDPEKGTIRKGEMQMGFPFYENLMKFAWMELDSSNLVLPKTSLTGNWWARGNSAYSDKLDGFYFFDRNGRHSSLSSTPKSLLGRLFSKLPAPLSAMQVLCDFDGLPRMRDKLSALKFHALALLFAGKVVPPIDDDCNFNDLMDKMGFTYEAKLAFRMITYSITNLSDADQLGPKFMHLFWLAYLRDKNILGCRMMNDDCNDALIDPIVGSLAARGVRFLFNHTVRDILIEDDCCVGIVAEDFSDWPAHVCPHCGLKFPTAAEKAFCPACGNHSHAEARPLRPMGWCNGRQAHLEADYVVSAMQPHQLASIYQNSDDHPLRNYPEFRRLGQFKGAQLTVSRVFMDEKVTEGYNLTGLDRDYYSMNGAMDLSGVMPKYKDASVFGTLSDDGEVLAYYPPEVLKAKLREDLTKIFPGMAKARVKKHLMAHIRPEVLYHRGVPRLESRFIQHGPLTPVGNFFLAGDWTDEFNLGKEAAVKSGISAANALLKSDNRAAEMEPLLRPSQARMVRWIQTNWVSRKIIAHYEKRYRRELPPKRG